MSGSKAPHSSRKKYAVLCLSTFCLTALVLYGGWRWFHEPSYSADQLGLSEMQAPADADQDGIDDWHDFVQGARADARRHPVYDGSYVAGGYPEDGKGVCTDVIWRAFANAGYSLKDMVDADIAAHPEAYPGIAEPDPNIDFRRVPVLHTFFARHALSLEPALTDPEDWQPGDLVIFGNDSHIGLLSERRNKAGFPFVLHNGGQIRREENYLQHHTPIARFRFDASLLDQSVLRLWNHSE